MAPDLVLPELANLAWRKLRAGDATRATVLGIIDAVAGLFAEIVPSRRLARRAMEISADLDHPAYDGFYLALAEAEGVKVVTADHRLLCVAAAKGHGGLVADLGSI